MAKDFAIINFLLYQVVKLNDLNEALFLRCVLVTVGVLTNLIVLSTYYHSVGTSFNPVIHCVIYFSTHLKISQLVPSLQTSRQQVVFARLVTSCQQVWNKLLTTCNNLVDIIRLAIVTRLFQQGCYNHDITIYCYNLV